MLMYVELDKIYNLFPNNGIYTVEMKNANGEDEIVELTQEEYGDLVLKIRDYVDDREGSTQLN